MGSQGGKYNIFSFRRETIFHDQNYFFTNEKTIMYPLQTQKFVLSFAIDAGYVWHESHDFYVYKYITNTFFSKKNRVHNIDFTRCMANESIIVWNWNENFKQKSSPSINRLVCLNISLNIYIRIWQWHSGVRISYKNMVTKWILNDISDYLKNENENRRLNKVNSIGKTCTSWSS